MLPILNQKIIEDSIRRILTALGEDPEREGLRDTPARVARLYSDVLDGRTSDMPRITSFEEETYHGIVTVHHVPFYAFCEHHMLPFIGQVAIGYIPNKKMVGLSKLVRIFRYYTKRVNIQERLAEQTINAVMKYTEALGAIVHINAEHTCMSLRGVKSPGARTTTVTTRGTLVDNVELQAHFLAEVV